jgi:hypothetical protein
MNQPPQRHTNNSAVSFNNSNIYLCSTYLKISKHCPDGYRDVVGTPAWTPVVDNVWNKLSRATQGCQSRRVQGSTRYDHREVIGRQCLEQIVESDAGRQSRANFETSSKYSENNTY